MKIIRLKYIIALLIITFIGVMPCAQSSPESDQKTARTTRKCTIAILPFVNFSGETRGEEVMMPLIQSRVAGSDLIVVDSSQLRQTLRKHRIRSSGAINTSDASIIADELGIDFILLGSIDVFIENNIPEAGFSARCLDVKNMKIFWAVSEAAGGNDFTGLLGIGQIREIDKLAEKLIEGAFKNFEKSINAYIRKNEAGKSSPTFALVPFDNLSAQKFAGDVISTILLTELVDRGMSVIEPGTVGELFRSHNRALRGEIDFDMITELRSGLNADYVITGSVNLFKAGPGGVEGSGPEVEFGGRCLDSEDGRIIGAYEYSRRGTNSAALLHPGSTNSLGELSRDAVEDFVKKVKKDIK